MWLLVTSMTFFSKYLIQQPKEKLVSMRRMKVGSEATSFANLINNGHIRGWTFILGADFLHSGNWRLPSSRKVWDQFGAHRMMDEAQGLDVLGWNLAEKEMLFPVFGRKKYLLLTSVPSLWVVYHPTGTTPAQVTIPKARRSIAYLLMETLGPARFSIFNSKTFGS